MNGIKIIMHWSLYTHIFNGKLSSNHRCDVTCAIPVYEMYVFFLQRLFPLQEPGVNSDASTLTKEEIKVNSSGTKLTFQKSSASHILTENLSCRIFLKTALRGQIC